MVPVDFSADGTPGGGLCLADADVSVSVVVGCYVDVSVTSDEGSKTLLL